MTQTAEDYGVMEDATPGLPCRGLDLRRCIFLLVVGAAVAALIPAFAWLAPASHFDQPLLLGTVVLLAVLAGRAEVPLPNGTTFEATIALSLITVAVLGPLPALLVAVAPIFGSVAAGKERLFRAGNLANLAAYGWELIAVSVLLRHEVAGPLDGLDALPWLLVAGPVQLLVNWALSPVLYRTLWLGQPFSLLVRMLADVVPATSVMLTLGAITAVLHGSIGVFALVLFALIAVLPQSALTYAARTRSVARLDRVTAARRYAHALALHLRLDRGQRRHLDRVVRLAAQRAERAGDPLAYAVATLRDPSRASCEAGHVSEWWDGSGGPAGLRGPVTPLAARITAVADAWSALTARDTPALSHHHALAELDAAAGTRLDPWIVAAAHDVVAQERVTSTEPAPEPRLHRLHIPARLRTALANG